MDFTKVGKPWYDPEPEPCPVCGESDTVALVSSGSGICLLWCARGHITRYDNVDKRLELLYDPTSDRSK